MPIFRRLILKQVHIPTQIPLASTDDSTASEIFDQIDLLSLPGAGLRHLDFQSDIPSIFQGVYSSDGFINTVPSELGSASPCLVRTYGSEPEMCVACSHQPYNMAF